MNIMSKHIETFIISAECLSFSQAAERLFLSPSTVSRDIRHLEKELGFDLFYRQPFAIQLTPAGEHMLHYFKEMLGSLKHTIQEAEQISKAKNARIQIGLFSHIIFSRFYEKIFQPFESNHPELHLTYTLNILPEEKKELSTDIFIAHDIIPTDHTQYEKIHLLDTKMYLLCSRNNPIAKRGKLTPQDYNTQTFYTLFESNEFFNFQKKIFKNFDTDNVIIAHADDIQSVLIKLKTDQSFMLVDEYAFVTDDKEYSMIPLPEDTNVISICAYRKKRNGNAYAECFMNYLKELIQKNVFYKS